MTNREKVLETGSKVLKEVGDVSILINNAGIMPSHPFLEHTEGEFRKLFEVNVIAHFWILQAFLPKMIENNRGNIVALSSMAGLMGFQNLVPYCGTKFAVKGIQEALSEELRCQTNGRSKVCFTFNLKFNYLIISLIEPQIKFTTIFPYMVDTGLCKKVVIRFQKLMPLVNTQEAAAAIISAQRKGVPEASIPKHLFYTNNFFRNFPNNANYLVKDFLEAFVDSDKDV